VAFPAANVLALTATATAASAAPSVSVLWMLFFIVTMAVFSIFLLVSLHAIATKSCVADTPTNFEARSVFFDSG
jgi:hypothetical protein